MKFEDKINLAASLYKHGKIDSAYSILKKSLKQQPNSFNGCHLMALVLHRMGMLKESIELYNKIIIRNPDNAEVLNNLANVYGDVGEFELAKHYYSKAVVLDKGFGDAFKNLANIQRINGNYLDAEKNFHKAISCDPNKAEYFFSLGILLSETGRFDQALIYKEKVIQLDPSKSDVYFQIFNNFMYMHKYQDALEFADLGLISHKLDDLQLCELLIGKAILFWLFDNDVEGLLALTLSETIHNIPAEESYNSSNLKNHQVFHHFLKKLFKYRQSNRYMYRRNTSSIIYFISESHGFSANGLTVEYQNSIHTLKSLFIAGAKVFHLLQDDGHKCKASLDILLRGLPRKSTVVVGFGEIDCRVNEGIFNFSVKYNKDISIVINEMIEKYIKILLEAANFNEYTIILYGVPAPHPSVLRGLEEKGVKDFTFLVYYFNKQLSKQCKDNHISFLDIYKLTNANGESNLKYHIDTNHVSPKAITECFKQLTNKK